MNTWEINIQKMLKKGRVCCAAIVGLADGKVYGAKDLTFTKHSVKMLDETEKLINCEVDELSTLKNLVTNGDVPTPPGIWMGTVRYHLLNHDEDTNTFFLKGKDGGATVIVTGKLILVGVWSASKKQCGGNCNEDMDLFAKDFLKANY